MAKRGQAAKDSKNYFSKIKQTFKATKLDKRFTWVFIIDLIYYFAITTLLISLVYNFVQQFSGLPLQTLENITSEQAAQAIISSIGPIFVKLISIGLALYALLYIFLKGTVWRKVTRQKIEFSYYLKLILFNIIFLIIFVLASAITFFENPNITQQIISPIGIVYIVIVALLVHFYFTSLISFSSTNNLFSGIKQGFKKGWKIWLFIVPYIVLGIIYYARTIISGLVSKMSSTTLPAFTTQLTQSSSFVDILKFMQESVQNFPKTIPFVILVGIIIVFFKTYSRILYAEFVNTQ